MNIYRENLINAILEKSQAKTWHSAVLEWIIINVKEDEELESSCVCGKEHLRIWGISISDRQSMLKKFGSVGLYESTTIYVHFTNELIEKLLDGVITFLLEYSELYSMRVTPKLNGILASSFCRK